MKPFVWYVLAVLSGIGTSIAAMAGLHLVRLERMMARLRRAVRRSRVRGAMFLAWALSPATALRLAGLAPIAGGDGTDLGVTEVRQALGIADDVDPVAAIKNMQAEIATLKATIAGDKPTADVAEMARLQNELADAKRALIVEQSENARKIAAIEADARRDKAVAKVEQAIARGKPPAMREQLLEVALMMAPDKFDEFLATIPSIDLTERGVATGHELAELEPTAAEIGVAKAMGVDTSAKEWRLGIMREKARARGLTLPAEVA